MEVRIAESMPTRPCKYCFAMQEDSVFADFDINADGCLFLLGISFDGYGYCVPEPDIGAVPLAETLRLESFISSGRVDSSEVVAIFKGYFTRNKGRLWEDALQVHGLI